MANKALSKLLGCFRVSPHDVLKHEHVVGLVANFGGILNDVIVLTRVEERLMTLLVALARK